MNRRSILPATFAIAVLVIEVFILSPHDCHADAQAVASQPVALHNGWKFQSSREMNSGGAVISSVGFSTKGWQETTVPSTVLAAQVAAGQYKDPYFGMNLRDIPGMTYPIGFNTFNNLPMQKDSPYAVSWSRSLAEQA